MKIIVFLHGTLIMHKSGAGVLDYVNYVPIGDVVAKLKKWEYQGAEIMYLSSHENQQDLEKDKLVLKRYYFPKGKIYWRQNGESYADIVEKTMPDVLIEDDCESIGGEKEMTYTNIKPELKAKIRQIVVKEFQGINRLPDDLKHLKDYGKYIFNPYHPLFEELFKKELIRLKKFLDKDILIEHVGSTAVKNLGGKGIIDILIGTSKNKFKKITKNLQEAGYEFIPKASTESRLFFWQDLPDPIEGIRRYHLHLTSKGSQDWSDILAFRDFLKSHSKERKKYEVTKKKAVNAANGDGQKYRDMKDSFIKHITKKALRCKANDLVKFGYNKVAETYLSNRDQFSNNKYLEKLTELLKPGATVLDIGCGSGVPVDKYLVDKGFKVIGIDFSEKQIELAKKNVPQAAFEVEDMMELKMDEYQVDAVVAFYAISHTPRETHQDLFNKINSFLPKGGLVLVTMGIGDYEGLEDDFHGVKMWWSHYGADKNIEIVKKAGFEILFSEIDDSGGESHLIILAKKKMEENVIQNP